MDITYLGHSSFKIRAKGATVVTDPYDSAAVGLKFPKHLSADIVTISHAHSDHNAATVLEGNPFVVNGAGEYEIKGVGIVGLGTYHDNEKGAKRGRNTIYRIEVDGVSVVHLGDLGHLLSSEEVDNLDGVDVLLTPVGGIYTINGTQAAQLVKMIEPAVVIPMHFGRKELVQSTFGELAPLSVFLKEMGNEDIAPLPKLTITREKIPEQLQVVVLE